ncbi:Hpt domain-containing protein [Burkholderia glumae]|uniref:Hpt domain-containing protein n=1 Tax=Burkholderia glumae TaxID=337 RepID=UPI000F5F8A5D|nr:Hpt domain-containing protein [Burkholderia glumae]MCQ0030785.1 Hpt domain-containing protein [Burkholderia glumae]MCQ0036685.1 Hpt domain-containing protein [Burkholderia glumae]QHE11662.1 hypothetical protein GQR88_15425 [Burkholderia glumae AU6208]QJW77901.1 Hpt domain-containing protein [Burkholderia glumae]
MAVIVDRDDDARGEGIGGGDTARDRAVAMESQRPVALNALQILTPLPQEAYGRMVRRVSQFFSVPIGLISFVGRLERGQKIGVLCLADTRPRVFDDAAQAAIAGRCIATLHELAADDTPDLARDVVSTYLVNAGPQAASLADALERDAFHEAAALAHTLKASSTYAGALAIRRADGRYRAACRVRHHRCATARGTDRRRGRAGAAAFVDAVCRGRYRWLSCQDRAARCAAARRAVPLLAGLSWRRLPRLPAGSASRSGRAALRCRRGCRSAARLDASEPRAACPVAAPCERERRDR